ncbi:cyclin-dependent kinase inhibitor 1Ba [Scomber scombrus]|uniref:cyclin-dependent kinase inhibitor 1Ba n=1 Tax=Scomber scombrus TaxID=13677 RepID=UPI002DDAA0CD|nr:cyclin-dependent kinase inhibitor 1Ba [Scomber scombrus]
MCNKMSDVRLSNASPTLERVDARPPDNVRPPVRRNLFGSPDREELRRYMTATMQDDVEAFTELYNFDPVNNRPLSPGNFVWQEDSNPPEFYLRPPHGNERPQREDDLPGDDRQDAPEGNERQLVRPQRRDGSRKRPAGDSGPCSSDCQSKKSHTDDDDDDDPAEGAGSQAVKAEEIRPDNSSEVQ